MDSFRIACIENSLWDFDFARNIQSLEFEKLWMAPEARKYCCSNENYQVDHWKIDVFSVGLITLFILDPKLLTDSDSKLALFNQDEKLLQEYLSFLEIKFSEFGSEFFKLLRAMLQFQAEKRISICELAS